MSPTPVNIAAFESTFGTPPPPDYLTFLRQVGGSNGFEVVSPEGRVSYADVVFELMDEQMNDAATRFEELVKTKKLIPFAKHSSGDYFFLNSADGTVWFYQHDFDMVREVAADLGGLSVLRRADEQLGDIEHCARFGNAADARDLISKVSVDETNRNGRTLLQEAARYGNLPVFEECRRHGASLDGALRFAAIGSNLAILQLLVDKLGMDINAPDEAGRRPLSYAFTREARRFLRERGGHK